MNRPCIQITRITPLIANTNFLVREAAKKVLLLMAGPLRGGGDGKKPAIKKKITFFLLFKKILMPFKNKIILLKDN